MRNKIHFGMAMGATAILIALFWIWPRTPKPEPPKPQVKLEQPKAAADWPGTISKGLDEKGRLGKSKEQENKALGEPPTKPAPEPPATAYQAAKTELKDWLETAGKVSPLATFWLAWRTARRRKGGTHARNKPV